MYQADFICTYKLMDTPEEQDHLYRIQLLQAFQLEQWDDVKINDVVLKLFDSMNLNPDFKLIIDKARVNKELSDMLKAMSILDSDDILFTILFKYEYFDLLHRCIADQENHGEIKPVNLNRLMEALNG